MGSERALIRAKDAEIEELKSRLIFLAADGSKVEAASSSSTQVSEVSYTFGQRDCWSYS